MVFRVQWWFFKKVVLYCKNTITTYLKKLIETWHGYIRGSYKTECKWVKLCILIKHSDVTSPSLIDRILLSVTAEKATALSPLRDIVCANDVIPSVWTNFQLLACFKNKMQTSSYASASTSTANKDQCRKHSCGGSFRHRLVESIELSVDIEKLFWKFTFILCVCDKKLNKSPNTH